VFEIVKFVEIRACVCGPRGIAFGKMLAHTLTEPIPEIDRDVLERPPIRSAKVLGLEPTRRPVLYVVKVNRSQKCINAQPLKEPKPSLSVIRVECGVLVLVDADLILTDIPFLIFVLFVSIEATVLFQKAAEAIGAQDKINIGQSADTRIPTGVKDALHRTNA